MIRTLPLALALPFLAPLSPAAGDDDHAQEAAATASQRVLAIERGAGEAELRVPREEKLVFGVRLSVAFVEADVGTVTMRSVVEPWRPSLLAAPSVKRAARQASSGEDADPETALLRIHARGSYAWYEMDATIETRILPQDWPRLAYRSTSEGSERRRREVQIGERGEEGWMASYRRDTDKNAPPGTRIWRDAKERSVPPHTLDLLTAVYLSRTLIEDDLPEIRFPLLDKLQLWGMRLSRGEEKRLTTDAGTFEVVEILLEPTPWEGEEIDEEKLERFEGLFGLHGAIHLWVERATGVPVFIEGVLPAGPLDLEVQIDLEGYEGTPERFGPVTVADEGR